jgi:hypothetical protein
MRRMWHEVNPRVVVMLKCEEDEKCFVLKQIIEKINTSRMRYAARVEQTRNSRRILV